MTKNRDGDASNRNAVNPIDRASGDRNTLSPLFGHRDKPEDKRRKEEDLQRQAEGTGVDLPGKRRP